MGNNIRMRIIEFWYHPSYMFGTRLSSPFWYLLQTDKHHTILGHQRKHQWTVNNKAQAQVNSVYIISENSLVFWNQTPADSDLQAENYLLFGSEFGSWGVSANCKKMLRIVLPKSSRRHMLLFRPHSRCGVTSLLVFQVQRDILMLQCARAARHEPPTPWSNGLLGFIHRSLSRLAKFVCGESHNINQSHVWIWVGWMWSQTSGHQLE